MQLVSGPGLVLYVLTVTLAAVDWVMSLDPDWYSTIYGLLFVVGAGAGDARRWSWSSLLALLARPPRRWPGVRAAAASSTTWATCCWRS